MSLIEIILPRRQNRRGFQPAFEVLEERQCLSVAAPTLQLAAVAPTQVKLTWTNVANESGYRVFRWTGSQALLVSIVAKDVTTVTVGPLQPNQVQWFVVEAFDLSTSARSAWVSIQTPADAITAPTNFQVTGVTQTQISLAWKNAAGATGYRVYGWSGTQAVLLGSTTPTVPSFNATSLKPGVTYYFYVQAFNATNTASTDWISGTTNSAGITSPTNVKATPINASTIGLSWTDVASETGYRIFRWDGNNATTPIAIATLAVNTTGYQAIGLLPGKSYWFYVQAYNATNFANSAWVTAQTPAALPLQPPTQVQVALVTPTSVLVSWVEPARAVGYKVAIWTGSFWSVAATVAAGSNKAQITGLQQGRTYYFMVQSLTDNNAETALSSVVAINL
ncbi:MAG: fibronectin type III domain-containing protein [Planctomycetes bacterium]|nr:fibronectin type III domain-containing protein [Planctomycetota bacterium]